MEILNLKLYDDPLNLSNFLVTHSNVRYVNLSIFADMEVSSKWASRNTRLHVERMLKLYDTDPEDIIVKLPNNGAKEITAIRFDWFVYIMIAVPDGRLKWTTARKQWVKHWCGECVPITTCPWSMNEPDPDISLLATSTPAPACMTTPARRRRLLPSPRTPLTPRSTVNAPTAHHSIPGNEVQAIFSFVEDTDVWGSQEITLDDINIALSENDILLEDINVALPDEEISLEDINIALPDEEILLEDINIALLPEEVSLEDINATLSEEDTSQDENANIAMTPRPVQTTNPKPETRNTQYTRLTDFVKKMGEDVFMKQFIRYCSRSEPPFDKLFQVLKDLDDTSESKRPGFYDLRIKLLPVISKTMHDVFFPSRSEDHFRIAMATILCTSTQMLERVKLALGPMVGCILPPRQTLRDCKSVLKIQFMEAWGLENIPRGMRVSLIKAVSFIYNSLL